MAYGCMCGATDCPSCGSAQGYTVFRRWGRNGWVYVNPEEEETFDEEADKDSDTTEG